MKAHVWAAQVHLISPSKLTGSQNAVRVHRFQNNRSTDPYILSLCAFWGEIVPIKLFTGTASYYKILPLRGPTPLLQNAVGVFDGGSITKVGSLQNALPGQVRRHPKTLRFFDFLFFCFQKHIQCLMNFDYNKALFACFDRFDLGCREPLNTDHKNRSKRNKQI